MSILTAQDKMIKARVQLQKDNPFFSYVTMHLSLVQTDKLETMGVDKRGHCYYNEKFVAELSQTEVKGVLCHEVMHVILEHLKRVGGRDHTLSNVAQDIVVNDILLTNDFDLPKAGILPKGHKITVNNHVIKDVNKKPWEEVYEEIYKHAPKIDSSQYGFSDEHIRGDSDAEGKGQGGDNPESDKQKIGEKGLNRSGTPEDEKEGSNSGGKEDPNWKQIASEAYAYAKLQGKTPQGMERYIEELNYPKLNWRQLLQKFIISEIPYDFTYTRPSKKSIAAGFYIPAVTRENLEIAVAVDTSGSMSSDDLQDGLSEVLGIVSAYDNVKLTVLSCDAKVHTSDQVCSVEDVKNLKMGGGGGTSFVPVFEWLQENKPNLRLLVFFTDGYGDFPEDSNIKTLWVLTHDSIDEDSVPFGEVVKMRKEYDT